MILSGWCSGPPGARPMCDGCRVLDCEHECHEKPVKPTHKITRPRMECC